MDQYQISSEEWIAVIDRIVASDPAGTGWTPILAQLWRLWRAQRAYEQHLPAPAMVIARPPVVPTTLPDGLSSQEWLQVAGIVDVPSDIEDPALVSFRSKLSQYLLDPALLAS
jgi:hypothetical protein